jgi:hypothetical protein
MRAVNDRLKYIAILIILLALIVGLLLRAKGKNSISLSPYPDGRNFAFTVTDDPDWTRLERIRPLYDFLTKIGMRTTVAVWVKEASRPNGIPDRSGFFDYGTTCENKDYLAYIEELQKRGFEIALHTVSGGNDYRKDTVAGYEIFKKLFGKYPKINIMHSNNLENVYWGSKVTENRLLRKMIGIFYKRANLPYSGEDPGSPYFWGDILKKRTKYVRLWGTSDINTLKFNPSMPYHDPRKPYVNYWFSFSDGYLLPWFKKLISDKNIDKLVSERGASIVYTHFAFFAKKDKTGVYRLNEDFKRQMVKISQQKDGWFVPASVLLDRLLLMKNVLLNTTYNSVTVVNTNTVSVEGLTMLSKPGEVFYDIRGRKLKANDEGEIVVGDLGPCQSVTLYKHPGDIYIQKEYPGYIEYLDMIIQRALILLFQHRGQSMHENR